MRQGAETNGGSVMADQVQGAQAKGHNGFLIGGGVLLALLLFFIFQNTADTTFKFLFWSFTFPLWLGLLITAIAAFVIGQFALMWRRHERRQARRDAR